MKILLGTFIAIFMIVTLQLAGLRMPKLILPIPTNSDAFIDKVIPRLQKYPSIYKLKKDSSFIPQVSASDDYEMASAYAVVDYESGKVLASKNLTQKLPIASLTKIMSAIVALDLVKPSERFIVSEKAARIIPTKIGLQKGEQLTLDELLQATLLTSANDAVEVIREGIDKKYNDKVFIRAMNEKADFLGLKDTYFTNPQGFDADLHLSSVYDVSIMTHYALENYPLIKELVKDDYELLPANEFHKRFDLYNWNGLIGVYPGLTGVKIGNTDNALKTTSVVAERNGKKLLAVLLGAPGIIERDLWVSQILDLGYQKSLGIAGVDITEEQLLEKYQTWKYW